MEGLTKLIDGAVAARADLTVLEIADALWLAMHMDGFQPTGQSTAQAPAQQRPHAKRHAGDNRPGDDTSSRGIVRGQPLRRASYQGQMAAREARPVSLPAVRELRRPLAIQRGLRPLSRTVAAGRTTVLDESATVALSAQSGAVIPALVRARERWLDLTLVIDASPSMVLWNNLVGELRLLLDQLGAFRSVRAWKLKFDGDEKAVIMPETAWGAPRPAKELIDPTGRQAILVVTDCVAPAWSPKHGLARKTLECWARKGPVAIVNPLPRRMWGRSAMPVHNVRLRSSYPGAPNCDLLLDEPGSPATRLRDEVAVPVLEVDRRWFASWARLVGGTNPQRIAAAFTGDPGSDWDPAQPSQPDPTLPDKDQAQWLLDQFRAVASPEAFRLAGLLAAAPLSVPMMRHIQSAMCTDQRPALLAEVLLSGLLRDVTPGGQAMATFTFRPHVRDLLLATIRRSEAIQVRELVSDELTSGSGLGLSRVGYAATESADPDATAAGTTLLMADDVFGAIDAMVLQRIGGRYAEVVGGQEAGAAWTRARVPAQPVPDAPAPDRPREEQAPRPMVSVPVPPIQRPGDRVPDVPIEPPAAAGLGTRIVMLGGPGSGKTTLLAALNIALLRRGRWRMVAMDRTSSEALERRVLDLTRDRAFPRGNEAPGVVSYQWKINGEIEQEVRRFLRRPRIRRREVTVDLSMADAPGEIFASEALTVTGTGRRDQLVDALVRANGIIVLFDPTREFQEGDTFTYVHRLVTVLGQRALGMYGSSEARLPHYVAVCVSKFDEDRVFRSAERFHLISYDDRDPYRFPRVADRDARHFLDRLCALTPDRSAELAISALESTFLPGHIKFFVTSAIGFNLDPRTRRFDAAHRSNYVADEDGRIIGIKGSIHPINVAEPLLWLSGRLADKQW
jgi:hypothetical protein